jgi:hypothetical protein
MLGTRYSNYTMDIAKKNIKHFTEKTPDQPAPLSKDAGCLFRSPLSRLVFSGGYFIIAGRKHGERLKRKRIRLKEYRRRRLRGGSAG